MNPFPKYYVLLRDALEAADAVDMYDLDSTNPDSVATWNSLRREEASARRKLVRYVARLRTDLLQNSKDP